MFIENISRQASIDLLARAHLARLACVRGGQPYIFPLSFAYYEDCLYAYSTLGLKITWMRADPRVCIEADELKTREEWTTVIVIGRYEELPDTPEFRDLRNRAYNLLRRTPVWWEPGYAKTIVDGS